MESQILRLESLHCSAQRAHRIGYSHTRPQKTWEAPAIIEIQMDNCMYRVVIEFRL